MQSADWSTYRAPSRTAIAAGKIGLFQGWRIGRNYAAIPDIATRRREIERAVHELEKILGSDR